MWPASTRVATTPGATSVSLLYRTRRNIGGTTAASASVYSGASRSISSSAGWPRSATSGSPSAIGSTVIAGSANAGESANATASTGPAASTGAAAGPDAEEASLAMAVASDSPATAAGSTVVGT